MFSVTVKTVLTPIAIVKDAANVIAGEEANTTKDLLESAADDVSESTDDLERGDLL